MSLPKVWRPTREQLLAAYGRRVPDVIAPRLKVLFVGINPSLYSAAVGHHFARPGNRFWPVLHAAGFTERRLSPFEERTLLRHGYGITNLVNRATASAAQLPASALVAGARRLKAKVRRYRPRLLAVLGVEAYRKAFGRPREPRSARSRSDSTAPRSGCCRTRAVSTPATRSPSW